MHKAKITHANRELTKVQLKSLLRNSKPETIYEVLDFATYLVSLRQKSEQIAESAAPRHQTLH